MTSETELFLHDPKSIDLLEQNSEVDESYLTNIINAEIALHDENVEKKLARDKDRQERYEAAIRDKDKPKWFVENFISITEENVLEYIHFDNLFKDQGGNKCAKNDLTCVVQFETDKRYVFEFKYTYESISGVPVICQVETAKKMMLLKSVLHREIYENGHTELINNVYNVVFKDHLYDTLRIKTVDEMISKAEQKKLIDAYHEKEIQLRRRLEQKWQPPAFEKGEIVGAKDVDGRWWMSRVLMVFGIGGQAVYYVEFLGWGEQFNRLITTPWEVKRFNPHKHKYFYPAWRRKLDQPQAKLEKSLLKEETP